MATVIPGSSNGSRDDWRLETAFVDKGLTKPLGNPPTYEGGIGDWGHLGWQTNREDSRPESIACGMESSTSLLLHIYLASSYS